MKDVEQTATHPTLTLAQSPHRHSFAPPRCRTSQYRRTFVPFKVSLWNDLNEPVVDGVGLARFKSRNNAFLLA